MPTYRHTGSGTMFSNLSRAHSHQTGLSDRFCATYSSLHSLLSSITPIIVINAIICQLEMIQISVCRGAPAGSASLTGRLLSIHHWAHPVRYCGTNFSCGKDISMQLMLQELLKFIAQLLKYCHREPVTDVTGSRSPSNLRNVT